MISSVLFIVLVFMGGGVETTTKKSKLGCPLAMEMEKKHINSITDVLKEAEVLDIHLNCIQLKGRLKEVSK